MGAPSIPKGGLVFSMARAPGAPGTTGPIICGLVWAVLVSVISIYKYTVDSYISKSETEWGEKHGLIQHSKQLGVP